MRVGIRARRLTPVLMRCAAAARPARSPRLAATVPRTSARPVQLLPARFSPSPKAAAAKQKMQTHHHHHHHPYHGKHGVVPTRMNWNLRADEVVPLAKDLIARSKKVMDQVAAVPEGKHSWDTVMKPLAEEDAEFRTVYSNCEFLQHVSPDKAMRDASTEADKLLQDYSIEKGMHEGVYKSVQAYQAKGEALTGERKRLLEKTLLDFVRNGLALPVEKREQAKALKKRLSEIEIDFSKHLSEDTSQVLLTRAELDGLPADFIDGLKREGDNYVVTMKYPDITPCLKKAKIEAVREKLERCYSSRCQAINAPLLEEAISIRHQLAVLLGYPTHADFVLDIRMAKQPQAVQRFYSDLKPKLDKLATAELQKLLELKEKEKAQQGSPFDHKINAWDWQYYHNMLMETQYDVDEDQIKVYFPLQKVLDETFAVYQQILDLKFEKVTDGPTLWHPDASQYQVHDASTGAFMGTFWIDLHPRDGKYSHAAAWPLQPSCLLPDGTRQHPATAMVCNFTKPTADKPSLLRHSEVETFFHEFGHVMHNICSSVEFARFSGTSVERDFVECPSQMLENWVWEKDVLTRLSAHYQTKEPLPDKLIEKMVAAKNVNAGLLNLRQMFFGLFDQTVHTQPAAKTEELWGKLRKEVTLIEHSAGTNPAASFGHLAGGYDASYYGYLWAEVFSADLFAQFKKAGVLSRELGKKYRDLILRPGGSVDAAVMLRSFLGREPEQEAFLISIGLKV